MANKKKQDEEVEEVEEVEIESDVNPESSWKPKEGGIPTEFFTGKLYNRETERFTKYVNGKVVK